MRRWACRAIRATGIACTADATSTAAHHIVSDRATGLRLRLNERGSTVTQPLRVCLSIVCIDPVSSRTHIIDDVVHGATAVEVDTEWLNEIVRQMSWRNDSCLDRDFKITEVVVNSGAICMVLLDVVCHAVTCVPCSTVVRGNVIRQLDLQKVT